MLHCNIYYNPTTGTVGAEYTETEKEVPDDCIFVEEAGCVQEAERMLRDDAESLIETGQRLYQAQTTQMFDEAMDLHSQFLDQGHDFSWEM